MGQNQFNDITEDLLQWKKDIPFPASLQNEFRRWQLLCCTKNDVPDTFLHALACCNVDSFPNIYQLLVIACTLPVTSAEAERSFSLLRRLMIFASHLYSLVYYFSYHFIYSEVEPNSTVANRVSVLNYKSSKFENALPFFPE